MYKKARLAYTGAEEDSNLIGTCTSGTE